MSISNTSQWQYMGIYNEDSRASNIQSIFRTAVVTIANHHLYQFLESRCLMFPVSFPNEFFLLKQDKAQEKACLAFHNAKKCSFTMWMFNVNINRRKFRSQASANMDRWKAEMGRVSQEKSKRKKIQVREKVGKSRNTVFFQWFVAPEGRKVGSLKRRVRSPLGRWEMNTCTPLWREAHFEVKMLKTPRVRATFGSWDVEKAHAVVARITFRSQHAQSTPGPDHFWKLRCRKSASRCCAKQISKSKC